MAFDFSPAWISLKVACLATVIVFILGLGTAWQMKKYQGPFRELIDSLLTLPLVLPPTVAGFAILVLIGRNGPIGIFLDYFGIKIIFSWIAAVLAAVVVAFPLMYKTTAGALDQIDANLLSVARTLGASEWKVFWKVAIPLAWPGIAAATGLSFARALGEFGATLMVAGNIPGKTQTIPLAIFFAAEGGDMGTAGIWVLIIFTISLLSIALLNYWNIWQQKAGLSPWRH